VYRNRYVVAECMVVQHINREEERDIDEPSSDWHTIRLEEERWSGFIELRHISSCCDEYELDECEQST
jgi:hypothetical protein